MSCKTPFTLHKTATKHICKDMFCHCKRRDAFSFQPTSRIPLENLECNGVAPAILVETYENGDPDTGDLKTSFPLELCDKLQFWTEGSTVIVGQPGSARVQVETNNILHGPGDPTEDPPHVDNKFFHHDTTTDALWIWHPNDGWSNISGAASSNDFWQTKAGMSGPGNVFDIIEHKTDICVGRTGDVVVGEGLTGANNVRLGFDVLTDNTGDRNVAIGYQAMENGSGSDRVAIGHQAGETDQGTDAIAIGRSAGATDQGTDAVAIGRSAGLFDQSSSAVAIGNQAGQTGQQSNSVAIGISAGLASQGSSAVAIGANAGNTDQSSNAVAIGNQAGKTDQESGAIAIGKYAGLTTQRSDAVAIGHYAGQTDQSSNAIAIGQNAGKYGQGEKSVAIGENSGQTGQGQYSVAIGYLTGGGQGDGSIAIGISAGQTGQGPDSVAIGLEAGQYNQGNGAIAIGANAGGDDQGAKSISIGCSTTSHYENSILLGANAGAGSSGQFMVELNNPLGATGHPSVQGGAGILVSQFEIYQHPIPSPIATFIVDSFLYIRVKNGIKAIPLFDPVFNAIVLPPPTLPL